jgi:carbamoyl-phosphate synthase large subunit
MVGLSLKDLGFIEEKSIDYYCVKESVLPFSRFAGVDITLGPEMKSTGEVMGIGKNFGEAFAKAQMGAGENVPKTGRVFISVQDCHKAAIIPIAQKILEAGLEIVATSGTAQILSGAGIRVGRVKKVGEGRPNIVDRIVNGGIQLVINTPLGKGPRADDYAIRRAALLKKVLCVTTIPGASAIAQGIVALRNGSFQVASLQDYFRGKSVSLTKGKPRARVRANSKF